MTNDDQTLEQMIKANPKVAKVMSDVRWAQTMNFSDYHSIEGITHEAGANLAEERGDCILASKLRAKAREHYAEKIKDEKSLYYGSDS